MNSTFQKIMVIIIAILVFVITFVGSSKEQVVVEANKIVTDSNNIDNNYLVGPKWLSQNLDESNLVILDIRSEKQYKEGHVPGAINAPIGSFIKNNEVNQNGKQSGSWTNLLNKKEISTQLQNLGITQKSDVVIYGESNTLDSQALGEISWIFKLVGINSRMLNGGYKNWIANGLSPVTTEPNVKKSNIEIENFVNMKALEPQNLGENISNIKLVQLVNDMNVNKDKKNLSANTQNNINSNVQNNNQTNGNTANNPNVNTVNNSTNTNNQSNSQNNQQANTNNPQINTNNNQNNETSDVIQIKLSELLNPNGTLKPVDKLDSLFESKGISPNNIILFYNTNNGNLAFLTLVLEMSGFEKIQTYNASLNQILSLEQAITSSEQNTTGNNNNNSATGNNSQANVNNNSTQNNSNNSSSNANNTTTGNNSSTSSNNNSNQ